MIKISLDDYGSFLNNNNFDKLQIQIHSLKLIRQYLVKLINMNVLLVLKIS